MEQEFISSIRRKLSAGHNRALIGPGDDAAVFQNVGENTVITVDLLTEGVDFLLEQVDPRLIGRKSLAVNLSDLAAMSAVPTSLVIAVAAPQHARKTPRGILEPRELLDEIFEGIHTLAEKFDLEILGGDTNTWKDGLVISITALGKTTEHGVLRRSGAKIGDRIFVTGPLGGSILQHQFTFEPRVRESLFLNEHYEIHSAMDISDGLSLDLSRLLRESKVGAVLHEDAIPISPDAIRLAELEKSGEFPPIHARPLSPWEHAMRDGEDFELIFTAPENIARQLRERQPLWDRFGSRLYEIGEIVPEIHGEGVSGLNLQCKNGEIRPLQPLGFLH